jgi:hypothetical protein
MGNAASDHDRVRGFLDLLEFGNRRDVDQQIRLYQAQVQHRPERLPAGQIFHHGVLAATEREGSGEVVRAFVIETYRFHCALRPACAMASRIRRGVIGEWSSSAPSRCNASFTPLTIAAAGRSRRPRRSP